MSYMTFNIDKLFTSKISTRPSKDIENALTVLNKEFNFERINPLDYVSDQFGYSEDDINQDLERLKNKRDQYENLSPEGKIAKMKADFLERIIAVGISKLEWFGNNTEAFLTSEYDDEINYIDGLIKFNPPQSNNEERFKLMGINFDATFTTEMSGIGTKIHALKSDLDKYNIPRAKYFKDPLTDMYGVYLPKVILGADNENLDRIIDLVNKKDFDSLKKDDIQNKLLLQAEKQLSEFKERFRRSSAYFKKQLEEAKRDGKEEEIIADFDLSHRKAARLFEMHSSIHGLVSKACSFKKPYLDQERFFSDAVHQKIMMTADMINKKKEARS